MSMFLCHTCDNLRDADDGCDEGPNNSQCGRARGAYADVRGLRTMTFKLDTSGSVHFATPYAEARQNAEKLQEPDVAGFCGLAGRP